MKRLSSIMVAILLVASCSQPHPAEHNVLRPYPDSVTKRWIGDMNNMADALELLDKNTKEKHRLKKNRDIFREKYQRVSRTFQEFATLSENEKARMLNKYNKEICEAYTRLSIAFGSEVDVSAMDSAAIYEAFDKSRGSLVW